MPYEDVSKEPNRRSIVWQYVLLNKENGQSKCKLCMEKGVETILFTKGGCTKTCLDHLRTHHGHGDGEDKQKVKKRNIFEKKESVEEVVSKLAIDGITFNTMAQSEMLQKAFSVSWNIHFFVFFIIKLN